VRADPAGRSNGRGAYLCRQAICWEKGVARRALERSLRGPVSGGDLDALKTISLKPSHPAGQLPERLRPAKRPLTPGDKATAAAGRRGRPGVPWQEVLPQ